MGASLLALAKSIYYWSSAGQRFFYYRMVHICNILDRTLKTAKSISTLKNYLKNRLITDFLLIACNDSVL